MAKPRPASMRFWRNGPPKSAGQTKVSSVNKGIEEVVIASDSEAIQTKAAPNNYRIDRVSGDPSVIARSPCDEAIQGPQHARSQQPRRSYCGPWIASLRSQRRTGN